MSSPVQDDQSVDAAALQAELETLYIPPNIDPRLLTLWIDRERDKVERSQQKSVLPPSKQSGRGLIRLFPAYIGIAVMCFSVILGLIQGLETKTILQTACIVFLVYTVVGLFVGLVAEHCVNDSVETMLRSIVKRSKEAGRSAEMENKPLS